MGREVPEMEIIQFITKNPVILSAPNTDRDNLNEMILYALGERALLYPNGGCSFKVELADYLLETLHLEDRPFISSVIAEMEGALNEIASSQAFTSLLNKDEVFLKYDYELYPVFSRLWLFTLDSVTAS